MQQALQAAGSSCSSSWCCSGVAWHSSRGCMVLASAGGFLHVAASRSSCSACKQMAVLTSWHVSMYCVFSITGSCCRSSPCQWLQCSGKHVNYVPACLPLLCCAVRCVCRAAGDVLRLGDGRLADGSVKPFFLKEGQTVRPGSSTAAAGHSSDGSMPGSRQAAAVHVGSSALAAARGVGGPGG